MPIEESCRASRNEYKDAGAQCMELPIPFPRIPRRSQGQHWLWESQLSPHCLLMPNMLTRSGHSQSYVCRGRRERAEHVPCLQACSLLQGRPGAQAEQSPELGPLDLTGGQVSALRAPQPSFVERRSVTGHCQCCHLWEEDQEGQFGGLPMYLWGWTNHEGAQPDPRRCSRKWDRSRKMQLGVRKLGSWVSCSQSHKSLRGLSSHHS